MFLHDKKCHEKQETVWQTDACESNLGLVFAQGHFGMQTSIEPSTFQLVGDLSHKHQ